MVFHSFRICVVICEQWRSIVVVAMAKRLLLQRLKFIRHDDFQIFPLPRGQSKLREARASNDPSLQRGHQITAVEPSENHTGFAVRPQADRTRSTTSRAFARAR